MVLIVDSVCIRLLNTNTLLVGIGNVLRLYHYNKKLNITKEIFLAQRLLDKIHGIRTISIGQDTYYGVIYGGREFMILHIDENEIIFKSITRISDWINNIQIYQSELNKICVLTSHSVALQIIHDPELNCTKEMDRISCVDKSTLYTSCLFGEKWLNTTVFGGTALGDLIIWSLSPENKGAVLQRLSGHNGVIFSIDYNDIAGILATTSDDRSVKIWTVDGLKNNDDYRELCVKPIKSLYGHTARIFRSKIIFDDDKPYIISIGEDSNLCLWSISSGDLIHRQHLPSGAVLWNLDYDSATKTIYTCGSDGNCNQLNIRSFLDNNHCNVKKISVNYDNVTGGCNKDEYLAKIKMISPDNIVGLTNANRLILYTNQKWSGVTNSPGYKCSLLECYGNYVITAGYKIISIYKYDSVKGGLGLHFEQNIMEKMIRSVKLLNDNELLICDDNGNCLLFNIASNIEMGKFSIPPCKDKWMTTALLLNDQWLVVADRSGNLHLFERNTENSKIIWLHTLKRLHGHMGCTCLQPIESLNSFLSCGHDGTIKHISIDNRTKILCHYMTEKYPIQWIEKIIRLDQHKLLAIGFNDNHFVVCDQDRQIIVEFECGGGHRYWDCCINPNIFMFIRKKELFQMEYKMPVSSMSSLLVPQTRWHVKACNYIEQICVDNRKFLLSGGDDNTLKFSEFIEIDDKLKYLTEMILHISNIKTIQMCRYSNDSNFLIFSAGGRAQICVTKFDSSTAKLSEQSQYMLRLTDLERKHKGQAQSIDFDPETRIMCMVVVVNHEHLFNLIIGCSDGYLRLIQYTLDTCKFELIDCHYYGKCFLHIKMLPECKNIFLTAATDGDICLWTISNEKIVSSEPFYKLKHHDSGINAIDVMFDGTIYWIATGGDDQAVVYSIIDIQPADQIVIVHKTKRYPSYHTGQVNGIRFSNDKKYLYSCGVDQCLNKIDLITGNILCTHRTCVADVKGIRIMNCTDTEKVFVFGNGLETINC